MSSVISAFVLHCSIRHPLWFKNVGVTNFNLQSFPMMHTSHLAEDFGAKIKKIHLLRARVGGRQDAVKVI